MDSTYAVWSVYDILEVTRGFLRENNPETKEFIAYGIENLNVTSLNTVGITKIIKIPINIVDLHEPLNEQNLTFEKISNILGEKCKMPITDYLDPRKKQALQMKQWKSIWVKGFERQHTIFVHNFEYSKTGLSSLVGIPTAIKNIDIISNLWPKELRATGEHPKVSQHLSMVPASSFMHFNLDSGGSSMWYNLIKGEQILFLVPPLEKNLNLFKEWVNKKGNEEKNTGRIPQEKKKYISFAEIADPIIKLILKEGESLIIPSGWSYSILTSVDSIVFSGRFLHIFSLEMQLRIHAEVDEQCPERGKSRFPYFEEMMWYLANDYVEKIQSHKSSVDGLINFSDVQLQGIILLSKWIKFYKAKKPTSIFSSQYVIDTICCFLEGTPLPESTAYQQDEEPSDSVENNNECYECNGKVESNMWVGCDMCSNWFHVECAGFSKKQLEELNKSEKAYICVRCTGIPDPEIENDDPDVIHEKKKRRTDEIVETS